MDKLLSMILDCHILKMQNVPKYDFNKCIEKRTEFLTGYIPNN